MRYAVYFTPPKDDPLAQAASRWLGFDAFSNQEIAWSDAIPLPFDVWEKNTKTPRRYGFHGTLKAPFRLVDGASEEALCEAIERFCEARPAFDLPPFELSRLGPFFALTPTLPEKALNDLATTVVKAFEPFRAPLTEAEIAKRNPDRLSERQRGYLQEWGYPHIFDDFRFHMTLTGPVEDNDVTIVEEALQKWFTPVLHKPVRVVALTLFCEPEPGVPFHIVCQIPFGA
ncbi:MAG: DUF1045 domain-containing protein [Pseudomonadota bacterium]